MTPEWRETVCCWNCGADVSTEKPLDAWIRGHPELDSDDGHTITDGDKIVHRFKVRRGRKHDRDVQYMMDIEVKTFARKPSETQRDTLAIHSQIVRTVRPAERESGRFRIGHRPNFSLFKVWSPMQKRRVHVIHYGHHLLTLSHSTPDDSEWMTWDNKRITAEQLVDLLRFDLSPDTLKLNEHRQHKRRVDTPTLFGPEAA